MSKQCAAMSYAVVLLWSLCVTPVSAGSIDNLNSWTQVQDPPHTGMTGSVDSPIQVSLTAIGAVPAGTDIGYQSVNGSSPAGSSSGNYFSLSQDFHIAVDFNVSALDSVGFAAIGFGIGEDADGMNSAGPLLAFSNGAAVGFFGAARINDITQPLALLPIPSSASGRFFVRYDSLLGDIIYGVNSTPGSAAPSHAGILSGLQNSWNGDDLLVSLFLRSDISPLTSGTVNAEFSNFEVLAGTPVSLVPLPAAGWLFGAALGGLLTFRSRCQTAG